MKTKRSQPFQSLPKDYAKLCRMFLPRPIHDKVSYENTVEVADLFAGFEEQMTEDQNDYFDLLCDIVEKYDDENTKEPTVTGDALLRHLVGEHGLSGAELSRILGKSAPLGRMILRGERKITASHAICLGKHFGLKPGVFLS